MGVKLQSRTQLVATGFDSSPSSLPHHSRLPPPAVGDGHVIGACTHVHKRCICVNVEENHGTMSTTRLSVSNLISLAFSLSPRSFSDAAVIADHYVTLQQLYPFFLPYTDRRSRDYSTNLQSRDLPPHPILLAVVFICVTTRIYDP